MTTVQTEFSRGRAAGRPRHRRTADRRRGALPRRVRRRRQLRLPADAEPVAGHPGLGGPAAGAVLDSHPRRPPRHLARELPDRRAVDVPHPQRRAPEPTISALTRIGTVEGFGGMLRMLPSPSLRAASTRTSPAPPSPTSTTGCSRPTPATSAGFGEVAGHDRMWFVARDIAFEHPATDGPDGPDAGPDGHRAGTPRPLGRAARRRGRGNRLLPEDIDSTLETLVGQDDRPPAHRDLRLPQLPVGRGAAGRPRPGGRRRGSRRPSCPTSAPTRRPMWRGSGPPCPRCGTGPGW